ncbi:MAG: hypothetical protein JOZ11_07430 [Alphaproteobacteria bacterium]|nr:hypothetical protein [Alphaproteobacteria bacterium]
MPSRAIRIPRSPRSIGSRLAVEAVIAGEELPEPAFWVSLAPAIAFEEG